MRFFQSIRWRLQLWHGVLFVLVLAGFGFFAWRQQRVLQIQRVDQELERRIAVIAGAIRRGGGNAGRPPQDRPPQDRPPQDRPPQDRPPQDRPPQDRPPQDRPPQDRPPVPERLDSNNPPPQQPEVRLSPREETLFENTGSGALYYVVWLPDRRELARSATAPAEVPHPEREDEPGGARSRGTLREFYRFTGPGECVLVGRDIREEWAAIHRFGWLLAGAGGAVLLLGLTGGWWLAGRALRPVAAISATAAQISSGDLSQRIRTADTSSELGELAEVLNQMFARLQASFARQAQFTADASHELRTPLTVVLTQTQNALARERTTDEYRESLAACQRAAERMRRLTESLLALARLDSGEAVKELSSCEVDRIAYDAVELLRPLAERQGVRIDTEFAPVRCLGCAEQLGQVVSNLVSNAIAHTRAGGSVKVRVATGDDAVLLVVSDTGEGIAPADLPHIFERFYRADESRTNSAGRVGLGLAITKAIVDAHGGIIEVTSNLGHGSTFLVRLPNAESCANRSGPA